MHARTHARMHARTHARTVRLCATIRVAMRRRRIGRIGESDGDIDELEDPDAVRYNRMLMRIQAPMHLCTYAPMHACGRGHMHIYMHTYMRTQMRVHTRTCARTVTCMHTHSWLSFILSNVCPTAPRRHGPSCRRRRRHGSLQTWMSRTMPCLRSWMTSKSSTTNAWHSHPRTRAPAPAPAPTPAPAPALAPEWHTGTGMGWCGTATAPAVAPVRRDGTGHGMMAAPPTVPPWPWHHHRHDTATAPPRHLHAFRAVVADALAQSGAVHDITAAQSISVRPMHVCLLACVLTCLRARVCAHTCMHAQRYAHTWTRVAHTPTRVCVCACVHACVRAHSCLCAGANIDPYATPLVAVT